MNERVNTFLLTRYKIMPEMHWRQPGYTYSACKLFSKHCERIQKFKETGALKHTYKTKLEKACFSYDAAYVESKELAEGAIPDKFLKHRACAIAINPRYDGYQRRSTSFLIKK